MKRNSLPKTSNFLRFPVCSYFQFFNHFSLYSYTITARVILTFVSIITPYFEKNKSRVIAVITCHLRPLRCRVKMVACSTLRGLNPPSQKCVPLAGVTLPAHLRGTVLGGSRSGVWAHGLVSEDTSSWLYGNAHPSTLNRNSQQTASAAGAGALALPALSSTATTGLAT